MKTLIVIGHPNIQDSRTQQFFKEAVQTFEDVTIFDVTADLEIEKAQQLMVDHQRIILQFPLYWYSCPACLKDWLDQILSLSGIEETLANKELGLVVSLGVKSSEFQAGGREKFTLSELMRPFEAIANKFNMSYLPIFSLSNLSYLTEIETKQALIKYQQYVSMEKSFSFEISEQWHLEQLLKIQKNHPKFEEKIQMLIEEIEENRDELSTLEHSLKEMKEE